MPEQWRPVEGWPGYEVSDQGRVRSWKSYHRCSPSPLMMRPATVQGKPYRYLTLSRSGYQQKRRIAHLVAEAFIGPRPDGQEVRHLNGDGADDRASNLAYAVHSINMLDRLAHGTDRNAAKRVCPRGHDYTQANTLRHGPDGRWRRCRTCHNERRRAA